MYLAFLAANIIRPWLKRLLGLIVVYFLSLYREWEKMLLLFLLWHFLARKMLCIF